MPKDFRKLSKRQQNILQFMYHYTEDTGFPPSIREIGEATDINSTSVVNYNLNKLVDAGYLYRSERLSRGLKIIADIPGISDKPADAGSKIELIPLVGQIVASEPVEVPDDTGYYYDDDDMLEVPEMLLGGVDSSQVYALMVRGDSMIDAMISDGDIVIMRKQDTANNGEMVAVWLDERGETTLKRFYKEGSKVRLQPAHPSMAAIVVDAKQCHIRGRVLSVIRQLS